MVEPDLKKASVLHANEQRGLIGCEPAELAWVVLAERRDLPHHVLAPLPLYHTDSLLKYALPLLHLLGLRVFVILAAAGLFERLAAPHVDGLLVSARERQQPRTLTEGQLAQA